MLRKVYGLLSAQLVITFGIVAIFIWVPEVKTFAKTNTAVFWSAFGLMFAWFLTLLCCGDLKRKTPYSYIALVSFTICQGFLLGCIAAYYEATEVAAAIGITIAVTLALTIFSFQTKWDFTVLAGHLLVLFVCLLTFSIFAVIFRSRVLRLLYASLGALFFSLYLVIDTQLILRGRHMLAFTSGEYVFATLNLYLDVVNLFMFILIFFSGSTD
ncbi:protein lifeguard 1-like [Cherax quadricarinatus]|uniref:protein lifeguard 1-like n=1 Tax=Cherax quadricarinatus TaxID=27406 RepID=UPI00387EA44D